MLTLPKQAPRPAWHQQTTWRTYVAQLFALISRKNHFTCEFRSGALIAGVIPDQRRVLINPALIALPVAGLRFDPVTEPGRRTALLRSIIAHEAGHVAFSAPKPREERLGWLWNALEDERMERRTMRRFPELHGDFSFLGDAMLLNAPARELDVLNACLVWRWAHDRPDVAFVLRSDVADVWENEVRPLVEAAWEADAADVEGFAQQILNLLPITAPQDEAPRPPLSADGGGMTEPAPSNPSRSSDPEAQPEQEAKPADATRDEPNEADQIAPNEPTSEDDTEAAADPASEETNPTETSDEVEQDPADGLTPGPQAGDGDPDLDKQADPVSGPNVSSSTPDPITDDAAPEAGPATGAGTHPALPLAPRDDPRPPQAVPFELEGYARRLSSVLAPAGRPAHQERSRSKGRFRYDRYTQGAERYFQRRVGEDKPAPFVLRLLLDTSYSMSGARIAAARRAALLLCRAAHLARSDVQIITFNFVAQTVVEIGTPWSDVQDNLNAIRADGGTRLAPALEILLKTRPSADRREVIGILSDGALTGGDEHRCADLMRTLKQQRHHPPTVFPLLIGEGQEAQPTWQALFGAAVPVQSLDDIALTLHRCLIKLREQARTT